MKVSVNLEFESPDHAIAALSMMRELLKGKGNFGETTAAPQSAGTDGQSTGGSGTGPAEPAKPTPAARKPRKPRKPKADPAPTTAAPVEPVAAPVPAPTTAVPVPPLAATGPVPSLADVQVALKGIFESKGAVIALDLLKTLGVERAALLPDGDRAKFIELAGNL